MKKFLRPILNDDSIFTHHLNNLYFVYCGLRPAALVDIGPVGPAFAKKFGLVHKVGPYFDIPGNFEYFVNAKMAPELEPLFQKLESTYKIIDSETLANSTKRKKWIGTILGFDPVCVHTRLSKTFTAGIIFETHPNGQSDNRTEVFAYTCGASPKKWIPWATHLLQQSKEYLDPVGLTLSFSVDDWTGKNT